MYYNEILTTNNLDPMESKVAHLFELLQLPSAVCSQRARTTPQSAIHLENWIYCSKMVSFQQNSLALIRLHRM